MNFQQLHENYKREEALCGIYIITNQINGKVYIGKSSNIKRRFNEHKSKFEWGRQKNKPLYKAFQKYGIENFTFEILECCDAVDLNRREKYWIEKYKSQDSNLGYNILAGGDGMSPDEDHPNSKLTLQDIKDIRTAYANHERKKNVEERYKNKIGPSGFKKIWQGITWCDIMPEVYTKENKQFHKNNTGNPGSQNGRALLNEQMVRDIRHKRDEGLNWEEVYEEYKYTGIKKSSFQGIWEGYEWKNV